MRRRPLLYRRSSLVRYGRRTGSTGTAPGLIYNLRSASAELRSRGDRSPPSAPPGKDTTQLCRNRDAGEIPPARITSRNGRTAPVSLRHAAGTTNPRLAGEPHPGGQLRDLIGSLGLIDAARCRQPSAMSCGGAASSRGPAGRRGAPRSRRAARAAGRRFGAESGAGGFAWRDGTLCRGQGTARVGFPQGPELLSRGTALSHRPAPHPPPRGEQQKAVLRQGLVQQGRSTPVPCAGPVSQACPAL